MCVRSIVNICLIPFLLLLKFAFAEDSFTFLSFSPNILIGIILQLYILNQFFCIPSISLVVSPSFWKTKCCPWCVQKVDINCKIKTFLLPDPSWGRVCTLLPSIHRHESQDVCGAWGLCSIFKVKEGKNYSLKYSTFSRGSFYLYAVIQGDINSLWLVEVQTSEPADVLLIQRQHLPLPFSCSSWTIYCPFTAKSQFHNTSH